MPWREKTYERAEKVYKYLLKDMIMNIDTDYDRKINELLIRAEVLKRDFTKRQLKILTIILTFSFAYGKSTAMLQLSDFALTGIPPKKINEEIRKLIEMKVITWDDVFNEFSVNDPREWEVPYHNYYDDKRSIELFMLNLKHAGVDTEAILEKIKELES
jgi:hypothetical protein